MHPDDIKQTNPAVVGPVGPGELVETVAYPAFRAVTNTMGGVVNPAAKVMDVGELA